MAYMTSWERIALKKGKAEGRAEGKAEGKAEGMKNLFLGLLMTKFGYLPDWVSRKIADAREETIKTWAMAVLEKDKLEEIFDSEPS